MKGLSFVYQYVNILSLDVVAGAVVSSLFFGALLNVSIPILSMVALALTVWIIYTIDHLRDAMTIPRIATTDRHRFHQKHFRAMFAVLLMVVVGDFILLWFLPPEIVRAGWVLGAIVVAYLVLQRYLKFLKEFFVACLYTLGVILPSLALAEGELLPIHYLVASKFFITALMNLLLFSFFDYEEDRHHQQHSFVTWFGPRSTRLGILFLGLLNIVSGLWLWRHDNGAALVFILMNLLLLAVLFSGQRLVRNNYYRIIGDAVFYLPAIYFL